MDCYSILGVPFEATTDEVRKAYLDLARIHHPDAGGGDAFKDIAAAYSVLKSEDSRARYDAEVRLLAPKCEACGGRGKTDTQRGFRRVIAVCEACGGRGKSLPRGR